MLMDSFWQERHPLLAWQIWWVIGSMALVDEWGTGRPSGRSGLVLAAVKARTLLKPCRAFGLDSPCHRQEVGQLCSGLKITTSF
ncbi:hypothetical protein BCV69DRAFT_113992 [Microstroma glucosiphilum]|uniref:Uncharacterized protein n=1 Tax=Pseudomicrostroma glucosiphilum TaxID=1684307 RepID=A0A316UH58_9BASI|nr:hypothetical protein BCV69DRAFT_113992 [Pseudomicrostroma glucosiphilum]PWN23273.1 hypothetical protein BCV69DRAFT_113992 [Pseudomicrostroma glucosiphilum]